MSLIINLDNIKLQSESGKGNRGQAGDMNERDRTDFRVGATFAVSLSGTVRTAAGAVTTYRLGYICIKSNECIVRRRSDITRPQHPQA